MWPRLRMSSRARTRPTTRSCRSSGARSRTPSSCTPTTSHYHWQTYGPLFRDLHKLFDEFAHDVLGTLDELAERVRMIGQDPPGHLLDATDLASVSPGAPGATMRDMLRRGDGLCD